MGWLIGLGFLMLIAIVILVYKRHGEARTPAEDWTSTDEVFRDPSTGRLMRVWLDREGDRHYVPDKAPSGPTD
jgi:hypothetical protein